MMFAAHTFDDKDNIISEKPVPSLLPHTISSGHV